MSKNAFLAKTVQNESNTRPSLLGFIAEVPPVL